MNELINSSLYNEENIDKSILDLIKKAEKNLKSAFIDAENVSEYNQIKVLKAMQSERLDSTNFNWTTGYGYGDIGRDKVENIYKKIFSAEDAIVRPTIVSGTHALSVTLSGILLEGDELISAVGSPYDTLLKVIGSEGNEPGTLLERGIIYKEIELKNNKDVDIKKLINSITKKTKIILIQRSTGYSFRKALTISEIKNIIKEIRKVNKNVICMVDNCYGEFVEYNEPIDVGADIIAGSLIKNPGGGLALSGGYIVGREDLIYRIANRVTAPGIGKDCGLTFGTTRSTLQGLFLAPMIVKESIKSALLVGEVFRTLGYNTIPNSEDLRGDIIQAIEMDSEREVIEFCRTIQHSSPVDSHVHLEAWHMPGYKDKVIMASGAFIEGSSIELSADAPIREPYVVYFQGGLNYYHSKYAIIKVLSKFKKEGLL